MKLEEGYSITYLKYDGEHYIMFHIMHKEVGVYDAEYDTEITLEELKAINKQIEELGWE